MKRFLSCIVGLLVFVLLASFLIELPNRDKEANLAPYSVMVDGTLYYTFMSAAPTPPDDAQITGYIESSVPGSQVPTENDQSNFETCIGEPYAMVDGELLVRVQGVWRECVLPD